ncbi:MAG: 2'-5' RNA ligase family protein [Bacillota bacterium]|nr:2'-5' RNA ligase family protein [Bacillota bacterium]
MDKFLCLVATFDKATSEQMERIDCIIKESGIIGRQTPDIPHHITLAYFDTSREEEVKQLLQEVCSKTKSFDLSFNHIGLFGLKVMFLAPDVNHELLELHEKLDIEGSNDSKGWTAHATILIDEAENIQRALPLVAENFQQLNARVEAVSLYEFFPTRFISEYRLR